MAIAKLTSPPLVSWIALQTGSDAVELSTLFWRSGSTMLAVGLGMVFCFSSDRPLFSSKSKDWLWRPLEGLMGLTNISKAFGDSLSYLRLFALGLASAQLAVTFNGLAAGAMEISGVGILLGSLIFLVGHALNLALGVVGGVVHGLRLNCIEFFSWSLTDEGYPFRAFCKKADR
jgi:V/A-type H+-transporting ATPase subunit I